MSTTVTQTGNLTGLKMPPPPANPEAWKRLVGDKKVNARLCILPDHKMRKSALFTSTAFQVAVAAFVFALPMFFPQKLTTRAYEVTPISAPDTSVPLPPKKQPVIKAKVQPVQQPIEKPEPIRAAKLFAPKPLVAPKPKPVEVQNQEAPKVDQPVIEAKFEAPASEPVRPREPVKTGVLNTGSAATATVNLPPSKVQTGGFGDPNGLPGNGDPNKKSNIAHLGSPALPPGPGYGNGTGGATGVRGTVASAGFGNGTAIVPPGGNGGTGQGVVKSGGFATASVGNDAPKPKATEAAPAVQPVVIVSKPKPEYSAEARKLGIEGDVLVEVVFPASGPVRVVRVVKGLGHGLDEAAVHAAEQIRFQPALQAGTPVDFPAVVHITFQIAF